MLSRPLGGSISIACFYILSNCRLFCTSSSCLLVLACFFTLFYCLLQQLIYIVTFFVWRKQISWPTWIVFLVTVHDLDCMLLLFEPIYISYRSIVLFLTGGPKKANYIWFMVLWLYIHVVFATLLRTSCCTVSKFWTIHTDKFFKWVYFAGMCD